MHTASKRKNNPPMLMEWLDEIDDPYYYFIDDYYDYCCGNYPCSCYDNEITDLHRIIATAYAERIIKDCTMGYSIKNFIIQDRLMRYTSLYEGKDFKDDLVFAWKVLQNTKYGAIVFSTIFGAK